MRIFLSGPMGSGKSSVAEELARTHGLTAFDLDAELVAKHGLSIQEIFREQGESAFRVAERELILSLLARASDSSVIALGGGTVLDTQVRRRLLEAGCLITLTAPVKVLARRVGEGQGRPLLSGDKVEETLSRITQERAAIYAESHALVDTSERTLSEVARAVLAVAKDAPLVVPLGARTTRVHFRKGGALALAEYLPREEASLVVTDENVDAAWSARVREGLPEKCAWLSLSAGESAKTLSSVERVWNAAVEAELSRHGCVVALGGGVVGDIAGFASSTWMRGVRVVNVPSTLLAMVDSSIGGKTGIDFASVKNRVGTFHSPSDVIIDVDLLTTLPEREYRAAFGEVVKMAVLEGEHALQRLERDQALLLAREPRALMETIRAALALKARLVSEDEHDHGVRRLLNLGHTFGHALEAAAAFTGLLHGEAVVRGLLIALAIGVRKGLTNPAFATRVTKLAQAFHGSLTVSAAHISEAFHYVSADKKRRASTIDFVLPCAAGEVRAVPIALAELGELVANLELP